MIGDLAALESEKERAFLSTPSTKNDTTLQAQATLSERKQCASDQPTNGELY